MLTIIHCDEKSENLLIRDISQLKRREQEM